MEKLINKHQLLVNRTKFLFERNTTQAEIDWNDRLIGVKGARGVGKTTFLLQHIKKTFGLDPSCIYISLDDLLFTNKDLYEVADTFYKTGGKYLFLDEVHKYQNWSLTLKNIYDSLPDLNVVFTGSSVLHIRQGNADLSRRAVIYDMEGLSFREFLNLESKNNFEAISLEELLKNHVSIAAEISSKLRPLAYFGNYLKYGYYPFYLENKTSYAKKLAETINLILEVDITYLNAIEPRYINKLKKLLHMMAVSVPVQPNILQLSTAIETSRNTVMNYLNYLEDGKLLHLLRKPSKGDAALAKPDKVYLHNTNLAWAIADGMDKGNSRETFFCSQVRPKHLVNIPLKGDFLLDGKYLFEVGGQNKTAVQIKDVPNSYLALDEIEIGHHNRIPLWLFGFIR